MFAQALHWVASLARALGFRWGFVLLCVMLGLAAWVAVRLGRRAFLHLSFYAIGWQRQRGMMPAQLQYDMESLVDAAPGVVRSALRYLAIALAVWLCAFLLRAHITVAPFRQLLLFLSLGANSLFQRL